MFILGGVDLVNICIPPNLTWKPNVNLLLGNTAVFKIEHVIKPVCVHFWSRIYSLRLFRESLFFEKWEQRWSMSTAEVMITKHMQLGVREVARMGSAGVQSVIVTEVELLCIHRADRIPKHMHTHTFTQ